MDYRKAIKECMKRNRITYADLATTLGTSRQNIWNLLNREGSMRMDTVEKIFQVLGINTCLYEKTH